MAGLITGLEAEAVRAATARVREEIAAAARKAGRDPAEVELLAAVKYIALEELGVIAEAGLTLVGENRAQELEAKAERAPGAALALHRPAPEPQGQADPAVRRADPLRRLRLRAQAARAPRHAGDRDPRRGQRRRGGGQGRHRPGRARRLHRARARCGSRA